MLFLVLTINSRKNEASGTGKENLGVVATMVTYFVMAKKEGEKYQANNSQTLLTIFTWACDQSIISKLG